jgi:hypothetical protein
MDFVNNAVYENGEHKTCLDMEKIRNLLIFSGFSPLAIKASEFDQQIDVSSRRELRKPRLSPRNECVVR